MPVEKFEIVRCLVGVTTHVDVRLPFYYIPSRVRQVESICIVTVHINICQSDFPVVAVKIVHCPDFDGKHFERLVQIFPQRLLEGHGSPANLLSANNNLRKALLE